MELGKICLLLAAIMSFCGMSASQDEAAVLGKLNEAKALAEAKKYVDAGNAYRDLSDMVKECKTEADRQVYVMALTEASSNYYMSKDSCEVGFEIAKALLKKNLTNDERSEAERYFSLNGTLLSMRCLSSSPKQYDKSRAIADEVLPVAQPKIKTMLLKNKARSWYFEAGECIFSGDYDKAYSCFENAGKEYDEIGQAEDAVKCLNQMAFCRKTQYRYQDALAKYEEAYSKSERNGLIGQQIEILIEEKKIYQDLDYRDKVAETMAKISLVMDNYGKKDVSLYILLGDDANDMGDNDLAETYYLKGLDVASQSTDSKAVANISKLYTKLRDSMRDAKQYAKAIDYENKRVETERSFSGNVFGEFEMLAYIYGEMGDRENALLYTDKYLASVDGKPVSTVAQAYTMSAIVMGKIQEYETAITYLDKAEELLKKEYGEQATMRVLALKSGMQSQSGHYSESLEGYMRYYEWVRTAYGEESTETCDAIYYLANIAALNGNTELGQKYYMEFAEKYMQLVRKNLRNVSSSERESYWQSLSGSLWEMTAFGIKSEANNSKFTESGYNALLFSKSLLLASEQSMYEVLQKEGTSKDLSDYATIAAIQAQINDLSRNYSANKDEISELNAKKLDLDRDLTIRCKAYNDYTSFLEIKYNDIKEALGEGEIVVDFSDYVRTNGEHVYAAYIIRKADQYPLLIRIFNEGQIDSLLSGRNNMLKLYENSMSPGVVDVVWKPLEQYIPSGSKVYYVPSGIVHKIAIESLPLSNEELLGDKYDFVRLSSAREILNSDDEIHVSSATNATLIGGLSYDLSDGEMSAQSAKYDVPAYLATRGSNRNVDNPQQFADLENSKKEVEEVAEVLKDKELSVRVLTGSDGTEEAFLAISGQAPTLMLISTHGFYYTFDSAAGISYLSGYKDAMSLSGLLMAGANRAWRGDVLPEGVLGGILTASKISRMDLEGNEITILSACQTGQGETTPEGVYGLQRAFKKAGVKTIIMTLWSVNDLSTKEFMTTFFKRLADNGWHKHEAFEYAKRTIKEKYKDPYHWAPFIMMD